MRYSANIGARAAVLKAAIKGPYQWLMLLMMTIELLLLAALVVLEALHR